MTAGLLAAALLINAPAPHMTQPAAAEWGADAQARDTGLYKEGTEALDRGDWSAAAAAFSKLAAQKGDRSDGALYWWAYALNRQGHLRHPVFRELQIGPLLDILQQGL